jgi:hypothetical protein
MGAVMREVFRPLLLLLCAAVVLAQDMNMTGSGSGSGMMLGPETTNVDVTTPLTCHGHIHASHRTM